MAAVAASDPAIKAMAASATAKSALQASTFCKTYNHPGNQWTSDPATVYTGKGLLLKVELLNNTGGWSLPCNNNHRVLLDGSGFTATNGYSTDPVYQTSTSCVIDESVRKFNSHIKAYLYNKTRILYIPC